MRKRSAPPPRWVDLLAASACARYGRRPPRRITWYRSRVSYSSGHCKVGDGGLHITAGTSVRDQQYVVLHELAHHLTINRQRGNGRRSWHNKRFHARLMELLNAYGDETFIAYAVERETQYMKRAAASMKPRSK